MRRKIIFALIVGTSLLAFYWFYSHSYIEVEVQNFGKGEVVYTISKEGDASPAEIKSNDGRFKRLVPRGNYTIETRQNNLSYWSAVRTGGFLSSKKLSPTLQPEASRQFIGNGPDTCLKTVNNVLVSWSCEDVFENFKIHAPATDSQPTYSQKSPSNISGLVEGVISTNEGSLILIDDTEHLRHSIYRLDGNGIVSGEVPLQDLSGDKIYSLAIYKSGFVTFSKEDGEAFIYASMNAKPVKIKDAQPSDSSLSFSSLAARGNNILFTYTSDDSKEIPDMRTEGVEVGAEPGYSGSKKQSKPKAEFVVHDDKIRSYSLNKIPIRARLCGTQKLCVLDDKGKLGIYDIGSTKLKLLYEISGVSAIESTQNRLLVLRQDSIYSVDPDKGEGFISLSLGEYEFCGFSTTHSDRYQVCISSSVSGEVVLAIDPSQPNQDDIDKKILKLGNVPEIGKVSVYGKYIYISPEDVPLTYDESLNSLVYDRGAVQRINELINQELNRLEIDLSKFKIVNTTL